MLCAKRWLGAASSLKAFASSPLVRVALPSTIYKAQLCCSSSFSEYPPPGFPAAPSREPGKRTLRRALGPLHAGELTLDSKCVKW